MKSRSVRIYIKTRSSFLEVDTRRCLKNLETEAKLVLFAIELRKMLTTIKQIDSQFRDKKHSVFQPSEPTSAVSTTVLIISFKMPLNLPKQFRAKFNTSQ